MNEANWALARKRNKLVERARVINQIRAFFIQRGYLEVETAHRIPANAPEPHIDAIASEEWVLHTSPEIAMKRMLAAGYEKVFQLCRVWRGNERGHQHLPEFTMLEWYRSGIDYHALMRECEELFQAIVPGGAIIRNGNQIHLSSPWEMLTVKDAFNRHASKSLLDALNDDQFEELLTNEVEPHLGRTRPTFLTEYPSTMAALARKKPGNPDVAERFELYLDGIELANAFSELTDPVEQRQRFEADERRRIASGKEPRALPELFLNELATMPEAAGIALGIDRLVMLLTGAESIDEVIAFSPEELG